MSSSEFWWRLLIFSATTILSVFAVLSGYPFAYLFEEAEGLRAAFRIGFSAVFLISILRSRSALPIIFGHAEGQPEAPRPCRVMFDLQIPVTLALLFGVATEIAALALVFLRIYFTIRTKRWGLENNVYQTIIIHLPFLGLGDSLSVDSFLGFESYISSPSMFNSLFLLFGIIMASGGAYKFGSEMWRKGNAVGWFVGSPHLRTKFGDLVHEHIPNNIYKYLTYITLVGELTFIFAILDKYYLLLILVLILGFSASLFSVIDLSLIGQSLFLVISLYLSSLVLYFNVYPSVTKLTTVRVNPFIALGLVLVGFSLIVTFFARAGRYSWIRVPATVLTGMNTPIKPFNEHHLVGVYTFRTRYKAPGPESSEQVMEIFDAQGRPGRLQYWYPRYFQASMYVVTDYCLSVIDDEVDMDKREGVIDICCSALQFSNQNKGGIAVDVKILDARRPRDYLVQEWTEIGRCVFDSEKVEWNESSRIPRPRKTLRRNLEAEFTDAM